MNSTILTLEGELKKREKKFNENAALPTNFAESVQHEIDNVRRELGDTEVTVSVVEAVTQADCVICYHAVRGNSDGALANDGDFIAVTGRNMMLIKEQFKFKKVWKRTSRSHDDALSNVTVAIGYKDIFQSNVLDKLSLDVVPNYTRQRFNLYLSMQILRRMKCYVTISGIISTKERGWYSGILRVLS